MAYIGNSPANVGNYQVVDDISSTFNGTLTSFALTASSLAINPAKSGQLLVSINGVLQEPDDTGTEGFKVSGSNIVFSSAPATGSTFWAVWQGQAVDIGTPSDGVVGTAQLSATGTKSGSTYLAGDNTWKTVVTDLVNDTTPQLGGDLDLNGHVITGLSTDPTMGGDLSGTASNAQLGANTVTDTELNSAKLNGIEAGATADQTGAQILALFSNSITAGHIAAGAIGASELGNDVVNSQHYAAGSIDNEHIADNAINSEHYAAGSIDNEHMAANSINSDQYVDGSIDRVHLAADIIDGTKIANDVINSEHYVAGSIDNEHISGMAASKLSGALPAIDGSSLTGVSETRATAYVQTATNRTINSSTTWTTHQTKTVTLGGVGDVRMSFVAASGYESGNVQGEFRFKCGSNLSPTMSLWNQFSQNKGHGSHGGVWEFTSIAAGSTVCELQVRNVGASSNIIMNYWDTEADTFMVNYPS